MKLFIDSSFKGLRLALFDQSQTLAWKEFAEARGEQLSLLLEEFCASVSINTESLSEIYVTTGPGSFTGIRLALSWVQGFCFGRELPIYPMSTFVCLDLLSQSPGKKLWKLPAYSGHWYLGLVENGKTLKEWMGGDAEIEDLLSKESLALWTIGNSDSAKSVGWEALANAFQVFQGMTPLEAFPLKANYIQQSSAEKVLQEKNGISKP